MTQIIRQYSLVKAVFHLIPPDSRKLYPFHEENTYVFLGEIPNMPGHCVVAEHPRGMIISGYHTDLFVEIPEDEA